MVATPVVNPGGIPERVRAMHGHVSVIVNVIGENPVPVGWERTVVYLVMEGRGRDNEAGQLETVTADRVEVIAPSMGGVGRSGHSEMVEGCRMKVVVPFEGRAAWVEATKSGRATKNLVYFIVQRNTLRVLDSGGCRTKRTRWF